MTSAEQLDSLRAFKEYKIVREITLEPKHIEYADEIGRRRYNSAIKHGRLSLTDADKRQWGDIVGARCECAAYLWARPVDWHRVSEERSIKKLPDLHDFIDVKGGETAHHDLYVKQTNPSAYAYLLVLAHKHPIYVICGWMWGSDAKKYPLKGNAPPYHSVPQADLLDVNTLLLVLRERQEFPERSRHHERSPAI